MRRREHLIVGWVAMMLAACGTTASPSAPEQAPRRAEQPGRPNTGPTMNTDTGPSGGTIPAQASPVATSGRAADLRPPSRGDTGDRGEVNANVSTQLGLAQLDAEHAYTLPELIDLAESANPDTRIAWSSARSAAEASALTKSTYLPHVAATVVGAYQTGQRRTDVLGHELPGDNTATGTISALSLQWLLFDFGARDARSKDAGQIAVAANNTFTAAHQKVMYEVCMAYYAYVAAKARVGNAEAALVNARAIEAAAQARYSQGVGTVVEIAQTRQASAQARLGLVQANGAASDANLALSTALGVSPLSKLTVVIPPERPFDEKAQETAERVVEEALERRPDVRAALAAQQGSSARVEAAAAELRPKVFLSTTGSYTSGSVGVTTFPVFGQQPPTMNVSGHRWGATVLLGVTMPLLDGGLRDSARRQSQADLDRTTALLERVRTQTAREVVVAQNRLRTSIAAHAAARSLEDTARTTFDAARDAYRHGVGSVTAATAAQTQLLVARDARTDAYSGVQAAAATLAFATGNIGAVPAESR